MSRTASRLAAAVLAAGALVTVAALPASAAGQQHGRHSGHSYPGHSYPGHGRQHDQRQDVVISGVHQAARGARSNRALNDEWVTVTNEGRRSVSLYRWTLSDSDHHVYRFGHVTLRGHQSVRVHTGVGRDSGRDLYQDRRSAVFERRGDSATLRDARGHLMDTDAWGRGRR